jgi:ComF family protein
MGPLARLRRDLLDFLMPWKCPLCRGRGAPPDGLCVPCRESLGRSPSWRCAVCGRARSAGVDCCPETRHRQLDGLFSAVDYDAPARRLVHRFKYSRDPLAGRALGGMLAEAAGRHLEIPCRAIVPVPLARRRLRERGFNQASLLARRLGRHLGVPVRYDLLLRTRETSSQTELPPAVRRRNIHGAFEIGNWTNLEAGTFLLVDDVYTTGATMEEGGRVLKEAGAASVFGVVFACARLEKA